MNWCVSHGNIPGAAVVLWVARVCCCSTEEEGAGFDSSITGLGDFAIIRTSSSDTLNTMRQMCESLLWFQDAHRSLASLRLWACVSSVLGAYLEMMLDNIASIFSESVDRSQLLSELSLWWDSSIGKLSVLGMRYCASAHLQALHGSGPGYAGES